MRWGTELSRQVSEGALSPITTNHAVAKLLPTGPPSRVQAAYKQASSVLSRSVEGIRGGPRKIQQIEPAVHVVGDYVVYGCGPAALAGQAAPVTFAASDEFKLCGKQL